jgi:hypothetical protein
MMARRVPRRGYALVVVLVFVTLFLAMLGVAWRQVGSALRLESAQVAQSRRDEGSLQALARAMHLLETGLPPDDSYVCNATVGTSAGLQNYTVTFTREADAQWSVRAEPAESDSIHPSMPATFAAPP